MKTIYLHIGMAKTGTSSIQIFLRDNEEKLKEKGYIYKFMPFEYPNARIARNGCFMSRTVLGKDGKTDEQATAERWNAVLDILLNWSKEGDNILLTDEAIWNTLPGYEYKPLKDLKEFADKNNFCLKVIVYLRRQDEYIESAYKQYVRKHGMTRHFDYIVEEMPYNFAHIDYEVYLGNIEEIIGHENFIVRRFDRKYFNGGTIQSDFMNAIGLKLTDEYTISEEYANTSLKNNFIEQKRVLNRLFMEYPEEESRHIQQLFSEILQEASDAKKAANDGGYFTKEKRKKFLNRFDKSNAAVAQKYFGEESLFSDANPKKGAFKPRESIWNEDLALFVGAAIMRQMREMEDLKKENASLKRRLDSLEKKNLVNAVKKMIKK